MPIFKLAISSHGTCKAYIRAENEDEAMAVYEEGEWRHVSHPLEWEDYEVDSVETVPEGDYANLVDAKDVLEQNSEPDEEGDE